MHLGNGFYSRAAVSIQHKCHSIGNTDSTTLYFVVLPILRQFRQVQMQGCDFENGIAV